jgi:hypothetical protein
MQEGTGESSRKFSKTLGSGQGEIFSCNEMEKVIQHFGGKCEIHTSVEGKHKFITDSLTLKRPVLFSCIMGNQTDDPLVILNQADISGSDYGPHWSLIILEDQYLYGYIDPNNPTRIMQSFKSKVLFSNEMVDRAKCERYWFKKKPGFEQDGVRFQDIKPDFSAYKGHSTKYYDLGDRSRQNLANVLIAIC